MGSLKSLAINLVVIDPATFGISYQNPDGSISYYQKTTVPCINRCDALYGVATEYYIGKIAIYENEDSKWTGSHQIELESLIKDDIMHTTVICDSDCSNLIINIYSLQGQLLLNNYIQIKSGVNYLQTSVNSLSTGMYLVRYSQNGLYLDSDKIIIIR